MSKSIILANGNILIGIDKQGLVNDFFFPYVGVENHIRGEPHRIGVWQRGKLYWLNDAVWDIQINLKKDSFVGEMHCYNRETKLKLFFTDVVYNEKNIFIREIKVEHQGEHPEEIKIFFHQVFSIYSTPQEDTAYFDPTKNTIVHYEGRRVFMMYAESSDVPFSDYSVGLYGIEGKEGTFKDAEDGVLEKNPIEHGHVDSVFSITLTLHKDEVKKVHYWITVGETKAEVYELHEYILYKGPTHIIESTTKFWKAWLTHQEYLSCDVSNKKTLDLFKKSLFYIRGNIDNRGAIIASTDSSMLQHGRDTYSYMWPRDGAMTVLALLEVGEYNISKHFFKFCNDVVEPDGYLMHKYRSDKSLGSSWHAFVKNGEPILPIQEDETALVLVALWDYYRRTKDIDFIEQHYNQTIKRMLTFLADFIDEETGLPLPSYDLWEEKHGISTFTACAVYAGLQSGVYFAQLFGKEQDELLFTRIKDRLRGAILTYLYDKELKMFVKLCNKKDGKMIYDKTIDMSSIYGVFAFNVLNVKDPIVKDCIQTIEKELRLNVGIDGVPRYSGDKYYMQQNGVSNPWYITTLWLAQYYAQTAENEEDLKKVTFWLEWVATHSPESGILSEQLHPFNGEQLSANPLTWSHAEYVRTMLRYNEALVRLGMCELAV
jgi:GH15 family glucan-1,4-alpha-glucosidase